MSERMYVWLVYDNKSKLVCGVFRDREEAKRYAEQYCTSFKIIYEVVN